LGAVVKRLFVVLALVLVGFIPGPASATAKTISVSVDPVALATPDGASLTVRLTVACPAGYDVLEAFVYVVQGDVTSNFVSIPLRCRNQPRDYTLTVPAPDGQVWTAGQASLSGYILLLRRSETLSSSPSATLQVVVP
jgi:hypothetical protein